MSIQHLSSQKNDEIKQTVLPLIKNVLPSGWVCPDDNIYIYTGRFEVGGPHGYAGLTGRKIVVENMEEFALTEGGISGKDPSKVDRSGLAYAARYIAKNIVASGMQKNAHYSLAPDERLLASPVSIF